MFDFRREIYLKNSGRIRIEYGVTTHFKYASDTSIFVESENEKFLAAVDVKQDDELVEISRKRTGILNDLFFWRNEWRSCFRVTISAPSFTEISGMYGSHFCFEEIEQTEMSVALDSGASGTLHCADVGVLYIRLSSGSSCKVTGKCSKILLQSDDSSTLDANCTCPILESETVVEPLVVR